MAKQKSGLGKGLGALFNDAPSYSKSETPKQEKKPAAVEEIVEEVVEAPAEVADAPVAEKEAADIYISEDALEHAKVVEREARPAKTTKTSTKKPSSSKRPAPIASSQSGAKKRASENASNAKSASKVGASSSKQAEPLKTAPVASSAKTTQKDEKGSVAEVPLAQVHPNPNQPRTNFKPEEIEELAASIQRNGLINPILVRRMGDQYEIIAGERRWQACRSLGMEMIPVHFWTADEDEALELALIENIQRSDLNPIEEAYGYKRLMERRGMTQSEVAQAVSKGRSTIANALRLLDLPEEAQQLLFEEKISAGHARAILSVPTVEGRKSLTNKLMEEKLSVRETEAIARLLAGREKSKDAPSTRVPAPASFKKAARSMSKVLAMPVRVKTVQGKNKIEIQFKDEDELQRVVAVLTENA
ncbi:ParB/RepB/Spo0J family partition protein [Anaerotardibacter muris]|uniref:ParB/RepB/Spo0J family partition protein n=1 Tax=Anaerotardibacter muris TaxID=2941505 RepID=UPI00203D2D80|nr:ParB/RepB/Spo0J family partition protein [Anaerotardibacter muris]